jgi:type VI protein secretion system component Hcp
MSNGATSYFLRFCQVDQTEQFWTREQQGSIKLPDPIIIPGESVVAGHEKEIQLGVWSFGISQPVNSTLGGGQSIGRASFTDFSISLPGQIASPKLLQKMCAGSLLKSAIVSAERTATQQEDTSQATGTGSKGGMIYIMWCFHSLMVSSYSDSGVAQGGLPMQHITLRFGSGRVLYRRFDTKTGRPVGWNTFLWDVRGNVRAT